MTFFSKIRRYRPTTVAAIAVSAAALLATFGAVSLFGSGGAEAPAEAATPPTMPMADAEVMEGTDTAVLAGGCFWGVEAVFERLEGVVDVVSGYSGGDADTAHYNLVGTGTTGHAEAVRVIYNPEIIGFDVLLDVFFKVAHDPTQLNYQGPDVGTEYRSAVFYANDEQKMITEQFINELEATGDYGEPIVTEVVALDTFYLAEGYHQDFLRLNPTHPYIVYWDMPKIADLEMTYPELLSDK
jgi:peptide-methionine (S)-S-oxide reductase